MRKHVARQSVRTLGHRRLAAAALLAACGLASGAEMQGPQLAELKSLETIYRGIGIQMDQGKVHMIYGLPMGGGIDPKNSAETWMVQHVTALGGGGSTFQEAWNADFKVNANFTVFTYQQYISGVPVEYGIAKVLILRDNPTNPVVYAAGTLAQAPAGGFVAPKLTGEYAEAVVQATTPDQKLTQWSKPELVVYQGQGDWIAPVLTWKFVGESPNPADQLRMTFFVDASNGAVVGIRNEVLYDVTGAVQGAGTPGVLPDEAGNPPALLAMPEIRVNSSGGTNVFADRNGNFDSPGGFLFTTISTGVGSATGHGGRWASVVPTGATPISTSALVSAPSSGNILTLNPSPAAFTTAEVNAYSVTDLIHNYYRDRSGSFNGIDNQLTVNTAVAGSCNAFFNGTSTNFFNAGGGCVNTAYSTVVAHEYGHYMVNRLGLAQNSFGEGFADVGAMFLYNVPAVGADFNGPGTNPVRNPPLANIQYPCSGEIHYCGQVLGGCWWNIKSALGLGFTQQLEVSWSLITTGGPDSTNSAGPGTLVEVLTVDDNDGNIYNGTPHINQICPSFGSHSITTPACGTGVPPVNDACANALLITDGVTPFSTTLATTDGPAETGCGFCCGDTQIHNDIWYTYTAISTGTVTVSLCGSSYDTKLAVYNGAGCPSVGSAIACNDDYCGLQSQTSFNAVIGQQYKIRVGGYNGQTGTGNITITSVPGNDNCAGAFAIFDGATPFGTQGATTDGPPVNCNGYGDAQVNQDVWYTYTATFTGPCIVSLCEATNYDSKMAVYAGSACPSVAGSELVCDDDACAFAGASQVEFNAVYGQQYKIRVGGFSGAFGQGIINIIPGNDDCANAFPISEGVTPFSTIGASTDGPAACVPLGKDVWYNYTAAETGTVTVSLCGSSYDSVLVVYDSFACPPGTVVACNDDFCAVDGPSQVTFSSVAGHQYKIRVAGYDYGGGDVRGGTGDITISSVPGNDGCANAFALSNGTTPFGNFGATLDGPATCAPVGGDVWFNYTASCTGTATINTCGSGFDTVITIYNGSGCPVGAPIACDDDSGSNGPCAGTLQSFITFPTTSGHVYKVRVSGYDYGTFGGVSYGSGVINASCAVTCYANCDQSTTPPCLNVLDFSCFLNKFAAGDSYANCDQSTTPPVLNVNDFACFLNKFAAGCSNC